jgi:hypothetical protein
MTRQPAYFEIANDNRFWLVTQRVLLILPWLWLSLFALLIVGAFGQQGSWPSYGQPDPKAIASLGALVTPLILLMMVTLASLPFGFLFTTFAIWQGAPYSISKKHTVLYLLGVFLFLAIVIGNAAGLMTWLMD